MIEINRQALLRTLAGAILTAAHSDRDVESAIRILESDSDFVFGLAQVLRSVQSAAQAASPSMKQVELIADSAPLVDWVYRVVQQKKITKRNLLSKMQSAAPEFAVSDLGKHSPRALIERFLSTCTSVSRSRLLESIGLSVDTDPYLQGIDSKR